MIREFFDKISVIRAKIQLKKTIPKVIHEDVRKLFVGGVAPLTTFTEFKEYFQKFGELTDIFLSKKSEKSIINNGFGFVTFKHPKHALAVLNFNKNHTIRAKWVS